MINRTPRLLICSVMLAGMAVAGPTWAQYKVVQPDGSVIYTDRPPAGTAARVTPMGPARAAPAANARAGTPTANKAAAEALAAGLPSELRTVVLRYPVTLYSTTECAPCDSGRRLLQARGVPFLEKRISTEEDAQALERLLGGRSLPALMIGPQPMRGYVEADWGNYLDAAGYPRDSKLPRGWKAPEASALAEAPAPAVAPAPAPPPRTAVTEASSPAPAPAPGSIRF